GAIAMAGLLALPIVHGIASVSLLDVNPGYSLLPVFVWLALARILPGERPVASDRPPLVEPGELLSGRVTEGWIEGRLGIAHGALAPLSTGAGTLSIE